MSDFIRIELRAHDDDERRLPVPAVYMPVPRVGDTLWVARPDRKGVYAYEVKTVAWNVSASPHGIYSCFVYVEEI